MISTGAPQPGRVRKHQRVSGTRGGDLTLSPTSIPSVVELLAEATAYWRRFSLESTEKNTGPQVEKPPPVLIGRGAEESGLFTKGGNILILEIETPLAFDSLTIPLVVEAAAMALLGRFYGEDSLGAEKLLWSYAITPNPNFILRFTPEGGPVPVGESPEPYKYWWEHDQLLDDVRSGGGSPEAFGIVKDEEPEGQPPPFIIPTAWVRSPWLLDSLLVGEGNVKPPTLGKEEREAVEKWEAEHGGPVSPALIAAANAEDAVAWEQERELLKSLNEIWLRLEELYVKRNENLCFKTGTPKACEEFGAELKEVEKEISEEEAILFSSPAYFQLLNFRKPDRIMKGPWMNGVDKWGYRINLHKPSMFPGVDLTKAKGTLTVEISPGVGKSHRLVGGLPVIGGWQYNWPTWQQIDGPFEHGAGHVPTPFVLSSGAVGTPAHLTVGGSHAGHVRS